MSGKAILAGIGALVVAGLGTAQTTDHTVTGPNNSLFGFSVAGGGDCNGDGVREFVVGVPKERVNGMTGAGKVRVFSGADWSVIREHVGTAVDDYFGFNVRNAGFVDNDGVEV